MKLLAYLAGTLTLLALMVLCTTRVDAQAAPTTKEVMAKLHKGENPPITALKKNLQADPPNWPEVQKTAHEFATLTSSLGHNDPPKGDKASWMSLTKAYAESAKDLEGAAQKKDKSAALAAHGKLAGACSNCHKVHRK